jgi:hypothetical protein
VTDFDVCPSTASLSALCTVFFQYGQQMLEEKSMLFSQMNAGACSQGSSGASSAARCLRVAASERRFRCIVMVGHEFPDRLKLLPLWA